MFTKFEFVFDSLTKEKGRIVNIHVKPNTDLGTSEPQTQRKLNLNGFRKLLLPYPILSTASVFKCPCRKLAVALCHPLGFLCDIMQTSIFLISKYIFKMKCAFHYTLIPSGSSKTDGGRFGANFETFKCPMPLTYTVQISNNSESPYASNFFEFPNKSSTSPKPIFLQSDWIHSWNIMLKFAIVIWLKITSW